MSGASVDRARTVMHIDMNAFFASVEQRCNPALRGKPIAVVGSSHRTVVTTASYEARRYGVKTGMNRWEAKRACPSLIFVIGDNSKYIDTSVRILEVLKSFSPAVETYSIDEAFLELTGAKDPVAAALAIKKRIREELGLTCSIGIAPNKLLSKLASDMKKPDGLVVIKEEDVPGILSGLPVGELWGIGPRLTGHLAALGVKTCGELAAFPAGILRERFGIIGERLKLMGQGKDPSPVVPSGEEPEALSIGHSRTLPEDISDKKKIRDRILKLSEMVGARAREHRLRGRKVTLTLRYPDFFTFSRQTTLAAHTNDTRVIAQGAIKVLDNIRFRSAVRLIGVSISDMTGSRAQMELFEGDRKREALLSAMDSVNRRFGDSTLTWATLLEDENGSSGVISPAWRPTGVKRIDL